VAPDTRGLRHSADEAMVAGAGHTVESVAHKPGGNT